MNTYDGTDNKFLFSFYTSRTENIIGNKTKLCILALIFQLCFAVLHNQ